jgi:L-fuculose-phosphate aldolase
MTETGIEAVTRSLIEAGRRLDHLGHVPARDGNLSVRLGQDSILITATGTRNRSLTPADLVTVDLSGQVIEGDRPSGELRIHLSIYRLRPDAGAVIHAHPPIATAFACCGRDLGEPLMPEVVAHLGKVPLTPYATPGTPDLEAAIADATRSCRAFLLENHGAISLGATMDEALDRMESVEHLARITLILNMLGGARPLNSEQLADLERLLANPQSGQSL